jgi:predicted nucleic acid-binding protein
MIVVDSSIWIGQLRRSRSDKIETLARIRNPATSILVGDLVLLEVLQGARNDRHAAEIERELRVFRIERMLDDGIAVKAAANYRALRDRGITVRKTIDLIIATFCVERGHSLLHEDRDFDPVAAHLGLRVV